MSGSSTGPGTTRPVPANLSLTDALALVREVAAGHRLEPETLALSRCHGRVLLQELETPDAAPIAGGSQVDEPALRHGDLLTPIRLSWAASLGHTTLTVSRKPTVAVFTYGHDTPVPGGGAAGGGCHDANRTLLMGLLRADGLEPTAWPRLPADPGRIEIALRDAGCAFDLIVICGDAASGGGDPVVEVLRQFGETHFRGVRIRPDAGLVFGSLDQARLVGMVGNPAAVLTHWLVLGRPLVDGLQGRTAPAPIWKARLTATIDTQSPQCGFIGAAVSSANDGSLRVHPTPASDPYASRGMADCNALVVVPEGARQLLAGSIVDVLLL